MNHWTIIVEDLAKFDLQEAYQWYEQQKTGLGESFLDELEHTISLIEQNPFYASLYNDNCRSASLKKFPYSLIYLADESKAEVYITAITHQHRRPGWFRKR